MDLLYLVGHIIYALPLLYQGVTNLGQLDRLTKQARDKGLPATRALAAVAMIWLIIGVLFILFSFQKLIGGVMAASFLVFTGSTIHNFWTVKEPAARKQDLLHFLKNLSLAGAALVLAAV